MSDNVSAAIAAPKIQSQSPGAKILRRARRHPGFLISASVILIIALLALFAPLISPHDPYTQNLLQRTVPPVFMGGTWDHPFGTDALGRDVLARLLYGARISLSIGLVSVAIAATIGTTLGIVAGYFGGTVDRIVVFIINVRLALPGILVMLAVVSLFGGSLMTVMIVMGLLLWDQFAVVLRSATRQVRRMEYIAAAEVQGAGTFQILVKDVLPNVANNLIVIATVEMAHAILLEAALSFLGLGIQPPTPSWGVMISEGKEMLLFDSWLITIPGAALFVLVLAINMFGDGLRDITAPEGRN
ncbi:ABC transporter permease [Aliihoeflea sp. PC F10.4]